jgi:S1-C subfamily serine protease
MSSYVCSRCGKKGPVKLRPNQHCQSCMSTWAWNTTPGSNQVMTITPEAVAAHDSKPATKAAVVKTSPFTWVLLIVSFVLSAVVIGLLVYFFKFTPSGLSGQQIISRFHTIAVFALLLAAVAGIVGVSVFDLARRKKYHLRTSARGVGIGAIILAAALFGTAVFCWSKTESAASLSSPQQSNEMLQRLQSATAVIQMHDTAVNRYSSWKREGVVIAADAGRLWLLTVPYVDGFGQPIQPNDVWVNLSDGRTLPARFRWAAPDPVNLAIVEVAADAPAGQVQFHPAAEAVIPSWPVFVIPNPLQGWTLDKATILNRFTRRTNFGWNCVVETDLQLDRSDVGSAMYDEAGRLMGFMISSDVDSGNTQFVLVDSAIVAVLESLRGRKDLNAQNSMQEQQP